MQKLSRPLLDGFSPKGILSSFVDGGRIEMRYHPVYLIQCFSQLYTINDFSKPEKCEISRLHFFKLSKSVLIVSFWAVEILKPIIASFLQQKDNALMNSNDAAARQNSAPSNKSTRMISYFLSESDDINEKASPLIKSKFAIEISNKKNCLAHSISIWDFSIPVMCI